MATSRLAAHHLYRRFSLPGHVAPSGEQTSDGDILVEFFPVQSCSAHLDALSLRGARIEQTRKPCQRHAERPTVREIDPHRVFIKVNAGCRNAHAKPLESFRGSAQLCAEYSKARAN